MAPRFLVPSLVWYGLEPLLDGPTLAAGVPALKTWGGLLEAEDHIRALLLTLDPAILLLNLAGYQVPEVVGGIPNSAQETALGDLVSIDVRTMQIRRGTTLQWVDPDPALASAHVALWIEPRFPAARRGTGVTLDLGGLAFALAADGISVGFDADGTVGGWTVRGKRVTSRFRGTSGSPCK